MTLSHPFQRFSDEILQWLLSRSRAAFWVVLGLFYYIQTTSMSAKINPDTILETSCDKMGALGFWIGFDYLFMAVYTLFFSVCCVWCARKFSLGSWQANLGILLAWAMIPQLLFDMSENWCMWQIAIGKCSRGLVEAFRFFEIAKKPLFMMAAGYALFASIFLRIKRRYTVNKVILMI